MKWVCCQIGARENYAVARALDRHGMLECLLTDVWLHPDSPLGKVNRRLAERFNKELARSTICAANLRAIGFELRASLLALDGWSQITARNQWFQKRVVSKLSRMRRAETPHTIFAFSYAARDIFRWARGQGWRTVLGQIDAGPPEERIVAGLYAQEPGVRGRWQEAPPQYWAEWREECALADRIVVNSLWSQRALEEEGVSSGKIRVIPLGYEGSADAVKFQREYPSTFTRSRPLRVLFLGTVCLRKGIGPLLDAIRLLRGLPIEFWFVGAMDVRIPADLRDDPQVRWVGPIRRSETGKFYRDADVLVFPTFSDGFGLTQLEAQAWRLPIIATDFCGRVVEHGHNGWLLKEVTGGAIADAIGKGLAEPRRLQNLASNAVQSEQFGLTAIGKQWLDIFE